MKVSKLCVALGVASAMAFGSSAALATDWVVKNPAGCYIKIHNETDSWVTTNAYNNKRVFGPHSTTTFFSHTGCSFGVPSPLGVLVTTKNVGVLTKYDHAKDTYHIVFTGNLAGSGISYGECKVGGMNGNRIYTSNLHDSYCFSPPSFKTH